MEVLTSNLSAPSAAQAHTGPLRVGVVLDSFVIPAWVKHVLEQLDCSKSLELAVLINRQAETRGSGRVRSRTSGQLFTAWARFDHRVFCKRTHRSDAMELVNFVPEPSVTLLHQGSSAEECLSEAELNRIRKSDLDVLLDFTGSGAAASEMKGCARYGTWLLGSSSTGLLFNHMNQGGDIEVRIDLVQHGTAGSLRCARFATDFLSLFRNENVLCWRKADAILRTLAGLHHFGWDYVGEHLDKREPTKHPLPGDMTMAWFLMRLMTRLAGRGLAKTFLREDWFIAYRRGTKILDPQVTPTEFTVVRAPGDRFYADPFVAEKDGRTYIFFEDYRLARRKAVISCVEVGMDGNCGEPEVVLESNCHLSYPCVFEWKGEMYLLPESSATGVIELYRAKDFPRKWCFERVLIQNYAGLDPTIIQYKGKFWLFVSGSGELSSNGDELFLFFSDTPLGPWIPHPKNPVISDVQSGRSAGHLFFENGQLIRPSQDSSKRYGYAVSLSRVDVLSEVDYAETPIASIGPAWFPGNQGTHTFNQNGRYQVVDGRVLVMALFPRPVRYVVQRVLAKNPVARSVHGTNRSTATPYSAAS